MTDATTAAPAVFIPRNRPVARFVAVLASVSVALIAVWATGLFNPRVELTVDRWRMTGVDGAAVVEVRNQGPTQAHVRVEDIDDRFVRLTEPGVELHVGPRKTARVDVPFSVDCDAYQRATRTAAGTTDPGLRLEVRARGALGPGHVVSLHPTDEVNLATACS